MALQTSGQISLANIATEFGDTAPHSMSEFYGAASGIPASGEISISDFYGAASFTMPSGIIIPYIGASTPSGWSSFSSADGKGIIGAGTTYTAGATGGTSLSKSVSLSSAGTHSNSGSFGSKGNGGNEQRTGSGGNHSHSCTISVSNPHPLNKSYKLIKASSDVGSVPANGVVLGVGSSPTGPSNIDSGIDRILYAGSSVGNGGSSTYSMSGTSSSSGSHVHGGNIADGGDGQTKPRFAGTSGGHTHTTTGTVTLDPSFIYAAAFSDTSNAYTFEGNAIAMWESSTPPSGWAICDGTNGTPDMRDRFVKIGTTANQGTTGGSNSHTISSISASGNITHGHQNLNVGCPQSTNDARHSNQDWSHSHSASNTTVTGPTPYYGLYFIMYTG